ncbi:MAG: D-alanine aminotransferase [marine bacterium B5-7]|nr:MAG: D-alanine aminotransferase [marine bacterium B5-7]
MTRTVYVNGEFVSEHEATVSVFDRAFLFADGVYEVTSVIDAKMIDNNAHLARLERSCRELRMELPCSPEDMEVIQRQLIERNDLEEGVIYLQVTRGTADRDFKFPKDAKPTLVMFTQARALIDDALAQRGLSVITVPDIRWKRRDIKTVGLLAASLAKQQAVEEGADDAWMVEDGFITEGSSNNAYIVEADGTIITRQLGSEILHGITRAAVLELCGRDNISVVERPFSVDEAVAAKEAFISSASAFISPVVRINDHPIGDGKPGPLVQRLREIYIEMARSLAT